MTNSMQLLLASFFNDEEFGKVQDLIEMRVIHIDDLTKSIIEAQKPEYFFYVIKYLKNISQDNIIKEIFRFYNKPGLIKDKWHLLIQIFPLCQPKTRKIIINELIVDSYNFVEAQEFLPQILKFSKSSLDLINRICELKKPNIILEALRILNYHNSQLIEVILNCNENTPEFALILYEILINANLEYTEKIVMHMINTLDSKYLSILLYPNVLEIIKLSLFPILGTNSEKYIIFLYHFFQTELATLNDDNIKSHLFANFSSIAEDFFNEYYSMSSHNLNIQIKNSIEMILHKIETSKEFISLLSPEAKYQHLLKLYKQGDYCVIRDNRHLFAPIFIDNQEQTSNKGR